MSRVQNSRPPSEDGYELWLRYRPLDDPARVEDLRRLTRAIHVSGDSDVLEAAREELRIGLTGLLGREPVFVQDPSAASFVLRTRRGARERGPALPRRSTLEQEGFGWEGDADRLTLTGGSDRGVLYGVFHWLRELSLGNEPTAPVREVPRIGLRMLNHWDNPSGTIERGYAGFSLWKWHHLPEYLDPRYRDYGRAMASLGLNATSLVNVNSNARLLRTDFLDKLAALAACLGRYGLRVFLSARFNAPMELGVTDTADPLDRRVRAFWEERVRAIYDRIPDFGGFVVKANSEGQPGPQDYGRSHAEGANLLARAVAPYEGRVVWRAFVYDHRVPEDRSKQAYDEFMPLDGEFDDNVLLQIKNGPIDFQPREPFHPLFGALRRTPTMLELQLTQEYLGQATHLVYLAPMFAEVLNADTFAEGPNSTVARAVDGSLYGHEHTGIAAVSNIGSDRNWCGHPFAQANWYAYGRLAWNPSREPGALAEEWLSATFGRSPQLVQTAKRMMLASHGTAVDSMMPLGLHHLMAKSHHYGPGPWVDEGRPDWTAVYYHRADSTGLGFDRSPTGSDAVSQYFSPLKEQLSDPSTCPEELLLWFHHVPWDRRLKSGRNLWQELCCRYQHGVEGVERMLAEWRSLEQHVDPERFVHVDALLRRQVHEARWWRDASIAYFRTFSRAQLPPSVPEPEYDLAHYVAIRSFPVLGAPWLG